MSDDQKNISVNIKMSTILMTIGVILLLVLAYYLRNLLLIILTSIVIAAAVEPAVRWGTKRGVARVISVLVVYVGFFFLFFSTIYFLVPPLFQDMSDLAANLPERLDSLSSYSLDPISSVTGGLAKSFSIKQVVLGTQALITNSTANLFSLTTLLFGGILSTILILVISFYLAVQEKGIENFLRIVTPLKSENYLISLWQRSQVKIGKWLQGQIILALIIGLLVFLGLTILRVKYALTLGIIAALFEIIPFFGPILSAVPGVLIGFGESAPLGVMVLGLYLIVHQFENHLIYPLVVKKIIGVPPLVVVIAIIVGLELAGFLGVILAVPLATVLMELTNDMEKKKAVFQQKKTD